MPRYIATQDGYLSDVCMHIKAGQVVDFPEGREPKIDPADPYTWLVRENEYKPVEVLPAVGAVPVVSEQKPKAHELEVVRPEYDANMEIIKAAEAVQDGIAPAPVVPVQPAAPVATGLPPIPATVPVVEPVIDTTPVGQADQTATTAEGSGNQDVL